MELRLHTNRKYLEDVGRTVLRNVINNQTALRPIAGDHNHHEGIIMIEAGDYSETMLNSTRLHGVTSRGTIICRGIALRTSNVKIEQGIRE
jgi:hypothetical protein